MGMWASVLSCCRGSGWPHPDPHRGTEVGCQRSSGRRVWADVLLLFFFCFVLRARSLPAFSATRVTKHFDQNSNGINQKMTTLTCCGCVSERVFFVVCWVWVSRFNMNRGSTRKCYAKSLTYILRVHVQPNDMHGGKMSHHAIIQT